MAYYDCIAHGEGVGVTCSECLAEVEADRDRLREERDLLSENYVQCASNVKGIVEALAAENAGLRGAIKTIWSNLTREVTPEEANEDYATRSVECFAAALNAYKEATDNAQTPSAAVERVLATVEELADEAKREAKRGLSRGQISQEGALAIERVLDAHDALQGLLEGKEAR